MLLIWFLLFSQEVKFESRIDLQNLFDKKKRYFLCIFTSESSSRNDHSVSFDLSGEKIDHLYDITSSGRNVGSREIEWQSSTGDNFFYLNFHDSGSKVNYREVFDKKTCSYRTLNVADKGSSSVITASAAFKIPRDVWAIKISNREGVAKDNLSSSKFDLYNIQYDKNNVLTKLPLYSFTGQQDRYFIVNPSTKDMDNFIFMNFTNANISSTKNDFSVDFKVSFIAAEQCLDIFQGRDITPIIESLRGGNIDDSITTLACLLTPTYVEHTLSHLYLMDIDYFFNILWDVSDYYYQRIGNNSYNSSYVLYELLRRVRFYYAYEISKDIMSLAKTKREGTMTDLEILLSYKMFDASYIMRALDIFYEELIKIEEQSSFLKVQLDEYNEKKLELVIKVLDEEFANINYMVTKLPQANFLAKNSFSYLEKVTDDLMYKFNSYKNNLLLLIDSDKDIGLKTLYELKAESKQVISSFNEYWLRWNNLFRSKDAIAIEDVKSYDDFMATVRDLFGLNVLTLSVFLNQYYLDNFEADKLKEVVIDGKTYQEILTFINDFDSFMRQ